MKQNQKKPKRILLSIREQNEKVFSFALFIYEK